MKERPYLSSTGQANQLPEYCTCLALSPLLSGEGEEAMAQPSFVPVSQTLRTSLQTTLLDVFPRVTPYSILLLHISQFEHISLPPTSSALYKKLCYHALPGLLEQILHNIRRALRLHDLILTDSGGTGAALLFPQVDQEGMQGIARRIVLHINLLQAETIVPPLAHETEIVLGMGSSPQPATTLETLFFHAGRIQERITFRPAVVPQLKLKQDQSSSRKRVTGRSVRSPGSSTGSIPFMQIPSRLPTRLKQLVPYKLALELRCAPVGRDHNRLTVAMANPTDNRALCFLREATGMTIFPVFCDITALDTLLASSW